MNFNLILSELLISCTVFIFFCIQLHVDGHCHICINLALGIFTELLCAYSLTDDSPIIGRPNTSHGSWILFLVPTLFTLQGDFITAINLADASRLSFSVSILFAVHRKNKISVLCLLLLSFPTQVCLNTTWLATLFFVVLLSLRLMKSFPASLTTGESILISQLLFSSLVSYSNFIFFFLLGYLVEHFKAPCSISTARALLSISLCLWSIADLLGRLCGSSVPHFRYTSFLKLFTATNILLCFLWIPMCILSISIVLAFSNGFSLCSDVGKSMSTKIPSKISDKEQDTMILDEDGSHSENPKNVNLFAIRKVFHFLAGFVYCTGLLISPDFLSASSACVLIIFLFVEWMRRKGPKHISTTLSGLLAPFRDSRDSGDFIFTPVALLLGLSLPVWGVGTSSTVNGSSETFSTVHVRPSMWAGVITIALGDSVAAIVGKRWGAKCKWPFTHRTLVGSLASLVAQLLLWALLVKFYGWAWTWGAVCLTIGVIAEAYTEQIDNLVIPLLVMTLISIKT